MTKQMEKVLIIGGGGTGAALAHDLSLRGFSVALFEKGSLLSGTTGRHHGLLHSGARYAVSDPEAARECITENSILRRLAPDAMEQNGGLFVALNDEDMDYAKTFSESCQSCDIPIQTIDSHMVTAMEPALNPEIKLAFSVPDAVMDAWRLAMHFFATARANGAQIQDYSEIKGIHLSSGRVSGVRVFDHRRLCEKDITGDIVVNTAGPWAGKVAQLANVHLPVRPGPGIMVSINTRLAERVLNRLHRPDEGDIIVPQRMLSILGTTLWLSEDPDDLKFPETEITRMFHLCSEMVPAVKDFPPHAVWSAARPLIDDLGSGVSAEIGRTFACYDHGERDDVAGLISVIGGKATTLRAMAEKTADLICKLVGRVISCETETHPLLHYREFFNRNTNE
jgi:glycerol-3-phosphate dehydrogenase